ncbi:hypothetical protein BKA58DRAFT_222095 [Alternaria rosae]|uniref:uncharacterized protein n=1 Tax=Alternaria rosae TaxID=1187941 RepID=UPI001E8EE5DC|nr:uncharacterized protein BKA58DRAFT_222095 [Alternaria rosae]KAH6865478.1 hypothetical protein BKA58DRAFT_222095 [Alternaria rosae]
MNSHPSPMEHMDVERRSSSPKRKKVRQKYAPKACVSCRRSKLKCSGENPCQRCMDNGKRCFFSEDQTAAEALQNLSRPTPALQTQATNPSGNGNGHNVPRRSLMPSDNGTERRASDASTRGMTMESRMARIEAMMEALMRDRGLTMTPMGSVEREENGSDAFRGDAVLPVPPLDPINPALAFMGQPSLFTQESADSANPDAGSPINTEHLIQVGNRKVPFPSSADYQQYLASFFTDIHLSHPCIDEPEFRNRSQHMLASTTISSEDCEFLALNYTIFACCDVLLNVAPIDTGKPKGWRWLEMADELVDKRSLLSGSGDLTMMQCALFQAIYYTYADMPGPAYNTIGAAARLAFQSCLHQQSTWTNITTIQAYERICTFWNIFVQDRFISLTCGRPYTIHETDIQVEAPVDLSQRANLYQTEGDDPRPFIDHYIHYVILWARYAGNAVDGRSLDSTTQDIIDRQISYFLDHDLPELRIPYAQRDAGTVPPLKVFITQKKTDFVLWGLRSVIISLQYDDNHAAHLSQLAGFSLTRMTAFAQDASHSFSLRHRMTSSLSNALLVLCSLLVRNSAGRTQTHIEAFRRAENMLHDLAFSQPYAKRVLSDFESIVRVVEDCLDGKDAPENVAELFPYQSSSADIRGVLWL